MTAAIVSDAGVAMMSTDASTATATTRIESNGPIVRNPALPSASVQCGSASPACLIWINDVSMRVPVVQVRIVCMLRHQPAVAMRMRVRLGDRLARVRVLIVLHRPMHVLVPCRSRRMHP